MRKVLLHAIVVLVAFLSGATPGAPLPASFTYQGRLMDDGSPAEGVFDFEFALFDRAEGGAALGGPIARNHIRVAGGHFTVTLDFGQAVFDGGARWLQIALAPSDVIVKKTVLSPRQQITAVPYALHAIGAESGPGYARIRVVSTVEDLRGALEAIVDASAERRYVIRLEPGWYDLRTRSLEMKPFVDIEGAGPGSTVLTGNTDADADYLESAIIRGADNVHLRELTIHMQADPSYTIGLLNDGASMTVTDVTFTVDRETHGSHLYPVCNRNYAFLTLERVRIDLRDMDYAFDRVVGVWNQRSDLEIRDCDIAIWHAGDEYGILNEDGWFLLDHTNIEVRRIEIGIGIACYGAVTEPPMLLRQSTVTSADHAIYTEGTYAYELDGTSLRGKIDVGGGRIVASDGVTQRVEFGDPSPNIVNGYPAYEYSAGQFAGNHVEPGVHGATIGGGGGGDPGEEMNVVTGHFGTVAGGRRNEAGEGAVVSGGAHNEASGVYSAVPGGYGNEAAGDYSFAGGTGATALHDGAFVWAGDGSVPLASTTPNQFLINAQGGLGINAVPSGGDLRAIIPGATKLATGTAAELEIGSNLTVTAGANASLTFGGVLTEAAGARSESIAGTRSVSVGQSASYDVNADFIVNAGNSVQASAGKSSMSLQQNGDITVAGADISLVGKASILGRPTGELTLLGDHVGIGPATKGEPLDLRLLSVPTLAGKTLVIDGEDHVGVASSSARYKTDVQRLDPETDAVLGLEPVRFKYKDGGQEDVGLIAEQVDEHVKDLVIYDREGRPDAVKYDRLGVYVLEVVKELKAENDRLRIRVEELEKRLDGIAD